MRLHFERNLDYQRTAIDAVTDLFRGQEICRTEFTVTRKPVIHGQAGLGLDGVSFLQRELGLTQNVLGIGNSLTLSDGEMIKNLHEIQVRNGLRPSESLASRDFTVEMETGTGKTYVYLRTIFELNKFYGFTKFVIVVPSVAIKEGVYKTLQMTEEHFDGIYSNTPFEYFIYDSARLGQVRNFASSANIQIMIVTVGAINKKDVNNLYGKGANEPTNGEKPIDLLRATHPIIIVDEPQSVDGGLEGRGKEALDAMGPLCTLRYSATHADKHHMVYRLDAVDAYDRELVKQIEVASLQTDDAYNKAYLRLFGTSNKRGVISARVEVDVQGRKRASRGEIIVHDGNDLEELTHRVIYRGCRIGEIRVGKGKELLEVRVPGAEHWLEPGQAIGDVDDDELKRQMIRRTIKEHLDKEKLLRPRGIKVLSLFFIDVVAHYRSYTEDGQPRKGKYAVVFEEEYRRLAKHPDYRVLFKDLDIEAEADEVHGGYFSIDKKKIGGGTVEEFKDTHGDSKADDDTYSLIMRDKEKLLSLGTKLKFIFSHSALREGWDNPNVFQICTLREMGSERERRQTIGRGLRLCVNQEGERVRGFEVNTLTVIANESYEQFAENLQKEIEEATGIRFGIVEEHQFMVITVSDYAGRTTALNFEKSKAIWNHLRAAGYVDAEGRVQNTLRTALKQNALKLPGEFEALLPQVAEILRKLAGKLEVKDADDKIFIKTRQAILDSAEFKALWDRIKHKTTYRVYFDNEKLISDCVRALRDAPPISRATMQIRKANLEISKGGVLANETDASASITLDGSDIDLPDLLTALAQRTHLTRRTIVRILIDSGRLNDFKRNPQQFIDIAAETIEHAKRLALVDGIKYQRIGEDVYYCQELFEREELTGYLKDSIKARRSIYERVKYQSDIERNFAEDLEKNQAVKVYAKLPAWFKVPTPLGGYNPDWAVLVEHDGAERLYFVVETKGSLFLGDLRGDERAKIECAKAHFTALAAGDHPARYEVVKTLNDLLKRDGK